MSFHFRPAKRENVPLLLGIAGGTGSGKTMSAMLIATGLTGDKRFAVIDTENGRAKHYADDFAFDTVDLGAPFRPDRYSDAIKAADVAGYDVIVVDSMTHEWDGDGGILDWQQEEFQRLGGRDAVKMTSWIQPKMAHRKFVTKLLQVRAHVILCFRAAERIDMVRDEQGKMQVVPKRTLIGLDGWVPICERNLPFELTLSLLLVAGQPGVPRPIKLPERLRGFFPLDKPISMEAGRSLAEWAAGGTPKPTEKPAPASAPSGNGGASNDDVIDVLELAAKVGEETWETASQAVEAHQSRHGRVDPAWLAKMRAALEERLPKEQESFADMVPASAKGEQS